MREIFLDPNWQNMDNSKIFTLLLAQTRLLAIYSKDKLCTRHSYITCAFNWRACSRATLPSLSEEYFSLSSFTVGEANNSLVSLKSNSSWKHRKQVVFTSALKTLAYLLAKLSDYNY